VTPFDPLAVDVARLLAELGIAAQHDGDTWLASCPSGRHADRNPSWRIKDVPGRERHGLSYCQSCKWGGTAVDLVRHRFGFAGVAAAIDWICRNAMGAPNNLERLTVRYRSLEVPTFVVPAEVLFLPFAMWAHTPRDYVSGRGILQGQVERWGLGYAVEGALRGRIVFPARDAHGVLLNYTARSFVGAMVRYKSASEAEGPDTAAIFGEQHWPDIVLRRERTVVVTEGAINALNAEKVTGWPIASLFGSKVQLEQVLKVASFGQAIILTDPDPAGDAAAERLEGALIRHIRCPRVVLPKGEDAASMSPSKLKAAIDAVLVPGGFAGV